MSSRRRRIACLAAALAAALAVALLAAPVAEAIARGVHLRATPRGPQLPRDKKVDAWLVAAGLSPASEERYGWALVVLALDLRDDDPQGAGCIWRSIRLHDEEIGRLDPAALAIAEEERRFLVDQLEADVDPPGEKLPLEADRAAPLPPLGAEPRFEPPVRRQAFYPAYTPAARKARTHGPLRLTGIVGTDGRYRELRVVEGRPHGLVHTALAAVCRWRFDPATRAGVEPMAVRYDAELLMEPP